MFLCCFLNRLLSGSLRGGGLRGLGFRLSGLSGLSGLEDDSLVLGPFAERLHLQRFRDLSFRQRRGNQSG